LTLPSIPFCHPTTGDMLVTFIDNDFSIPEEKSLVYAHLVIINTFYPERVEKVYFRNNTFHDEIVLDMP